MSRFGKHNKPTETFTDRLIANDFVERAIVHRSGHVELWNCLYELQNTPEERRILYTANWVTANQKPYHYVEEIFLNPGKSDFVDKKLSFSPLDDERVALRVKTLDSNLGLTGFVSNEFNQFVDAVDDVILITKAEPTSGEGPRALFVNGAFERMTGYRPDEIIGLTPRILQGEDTKEAAKAKIRDAFANWKQATCQIDNYTKDGKHFIVELHLTPLQDDIGWWTHWISLQRDVTRRLNDEQKLLRQEAHLLRKSRLANIGEISSNVFHEVYNPLTILIGHLHILNDQLEEGEVSQEQIKTALEKMLIAGHRMEDVLAGIRKLSRNSVKLETETFSVKREIDEVVSLITQLYKQDGIQLKLSFCDSDPFINGDPGKLQQVLLNLLSNARDATKTMADSKWIAVNLVVDNDCCRIIVTNSGTPIPEVLREKIFWPFFTTKGETEGTGLGLSIVRQFVTDMNGKIQYEALGCNGSKFEVQLPLAS